MAKAFNRKHEVVALMAGTMADALNPGPERRVMRLRKEATPRVFLADNSRLKADAYKQREQVDAICASHDLKAEWPSEHFLFPTGLTFSDRTNIGPPINDPAPGRVLHNAWRLMTDYDAIVAEVTPFRGAHLNPVIAFEIGVAVVLDIPVFAWTTEVWPASPSGRHLEASRFKTLDDRIWCGDRAAPDGNWRDEEGYLVEDLGTVESALIAGNFKSLSPSRAEAICRCAEFLKRERAG